MVNMLIVASIVDEKFTSGKQCSKDNVPNILENLWILGINDTTVVITASTSSSTFIMILNMSS